MQETINPAGRGRIEILDVARAIALLAMAVYHFTWDLEFFGYVERGLTAIGGWRLFARCIASSFLFLVGVSLILAHGRAIRWKSFTRRLLQIVAGAAAITLVTWFATPGGFVFFGILHQIALASVLGLAFLRLPWMLTALAAALVIALPHFVSTPLTDPRPLAWIGLSELPPFSNDFVPLFPWFGAVLFGIAAARLATDTGFWDRLRSLNDRLRRLSPLARLGRHSLLFYLLHQPVLFGLVFAFAQVSPPDLTARFEGECRRQCMMTQGEAACTDYCACAQRELSARDLMDAVMSGAGDEAQQTAIQDIVRLCSFEVLPQP